MKVRLATVGTLIAIPLLLGACSSGTTVEVSCDDFMEDNHITRQVEVSTGETFTVTLCSNASTGFQWVEPAQVSDKGVLRQTGHEFIAPEEEDGELPAPGTAGQQQWTFEALRKGTTEVSMEYSRPWEGGEKGAWTFTLTVVVK
jgi:inhibitor of cysteine peptidase